MKLNNVYKIDNVNQNWLDNSKYTFSFKKSGNYVYDGETLERLAKRVWRKLDLDKYFENLINQLPLIEFNYSGTKNSREFIFNFFENIIHKNISQSIYRFKELGIRTLYIWEYRLLSDFSFVSQNITDFEKKEELRQQILLIYECFIEKPYKELEKIKFRIKEKESL